MVRVLGFDCAGRGCAAAAVAGGRILAQRALPAMERGQAEALLPLIQAVMAEAATGFAELDLIGVTVGPGAFTGLRIGLAAARGLALATGLPVVGVTSFAAIAAAVPPEARAGRPLVVALDSKRTELFLQLFSPEGPAHEAGALLAPEQAASLLPPGALVLAGDGAPRLAAALGRRAALASNADLPNPADIARLALAQWRPGERPDLPRPLYLRAPDTTAPLPMAAP